MARKYFILFIVITLCLFSLMSAFMGERGFFANKELERQLKANEYRLDRDEVELENLRNQEEELSTEDGIRFAAMNLGYQVEGDDVYRFNSSDDESILPGLQQVSYSASLTSEDTEQKVFKPWSTGTCFGLAFGLSLVLTFLVWVLGKKGKNGNDSKQDESGDFGNDFNLD